YSSRRCGDSFFFQAEDGIRAFHVTGVQTCALPILSMVRLWTTVGISVLVTWASSPLKMKLAPSLSITSPLVWMVPATPPGWAVRSEERRVGKEGSTRRGTSQRERKSSFRVEPLGAQ